MFSSNTSQVSSSAANYIEDVFSTWLYTGNGSTQTINNGIDLAGKGGLVWIKARNAAYGLLNWDTSMPYFSNLSTYNTDALVNQGSPFGIASTSATGFATGNTNWARINESGTTYASWTFRKQPKFFDVVTYTGNNTAGRTVAHNLGSVPGCIIVKCTSTSGAWTVYHRSPGATKYLILNNTDAETTFSGMWNNTEPTATEFTLGASGFVNAPGATYVAYLFAHNAGGFGLTGTDNVISCGSFTADGAGNATVELGYEPQWLLLKSPSGGFWRIFDVMRGLSVSNNTAGLFPNAADAEVVWGAQYANPTATGFQLGDGFWGVNDPGIYIAIRRGPMKVPTTGTQVYNALTRNGTASTYTSGSFGFVPDWLMIEGRTSTAGPRGIVYDRLRGFSNSRAVYSLTTSTQGENTFGASGITAFGQTAYTAGAESFINANNAPYVDYAMGRAPGFMDIVCYTGSSSARTLTHNLKVVPEMMIVKSRAVGSQGPYNWTVYHSALSAGGFAYLNLTNAGVFSGNTSFWNGTAPTASVFSLGGASGTNESGFRYVNYLFASCPGVSKVGSFTGTGATQVINCGFTNGARFVMIKATSTTGNWLVWDSARGIVAGNDPYLAWNSTAAEVTNTDWVDTAATGFELSNDAGNLANSNGVSYIYLAIA